MNRRGFLLAIGIAPLVARIPKFLLAEPASPPPGPLLFDSIREIGQWDIRTDSIIVRHDVMVGYWGSGGTQLGVDQLIETPITRDGMLKALATARMVAADFLREKMIADGLSFADLRPLTMPHGLVNPWDDPKAWRE